MARTPLSGHHGRSGSCPNRTSWLYSRGMNETFLGELPAWLTEAGLAGTPETEIVSGFCERCVAAGLPLARALVLIDTLHPVHEGRLFRWSDGPAKAPCWNTAAPTRKGSPRRAPTPRLSRRPSAGGAVHSTGCCRPATRFCAAA